MTVSLHGRRVPLPAGSGPSEFERMGELARVVDGILIAQTVSALVLALLVQGFYRHYGKSYLRYWAWSWWAMAAYSLATFGSLAAYRSDLGSGAAVSLSLVRGIGGNVHVGLLAIGVWEMTRRRLVRLRTVRRSLLALGAAGLLAALLVLEPQGSALREFLRIGMRSLIGGSVLTVAAALCWRRRERGRGIGHDVVCLAVFAYGLHHLHLFGIFVVDRLVDLDMGYTVYLGFIESLVHLVLGVGMVACLLEDERQAAVLAGQEIEHLAYHDALTGLPNRPLFIDRLIVALAHATRQRQKLAVFFLDVDRFKDINDSLGHSLGDVLLKSIAERIRRCVRAEDTVARFGGDEFTLVIQRITHAEDAAKVAEKLLESLRQPIRVGDHELFVTTSIGISLFPTDGTDAETLVKNADTAMYRAKDHGRDHYEIYAPAMNARALERLAQENLLRRALENGELEIYYQPLIDVKNARISGAEALLRWRHPEHGILTPYHFLPTLESSGLILAVGDWVLREACRQAVTWSAEGRPFEISVNLSPRQFQQPELISRIKDALDESGLHPSRLELEITENNAMQNAEQSVRTLRDLRALGVRIAMDDFGTGYSSLNYLKRFPIDTLKLDQSFVRDVNHDPGDAAIASAVMAMAQTLNLSVVAEGVETREQLDFFRSRECGRLQGFYFSRPVPASEFGAYLERFSGLDAAAVETA